MIPHIKTMIPSEGDQWGRDEIYPDVYPLVNVYITMENRHAING